MASEKENTIEKNFNELLTACQEIMPILEGAVEWKSVFHPEFKAVREFRELIKKFEEGE